VEGLQPAEVEHESSVTLPYAHVQKASLVLTLGLSHDRRVRRMPALPPSLLVAITVVLWASAFPAIRVALESFSPVSLSLARVGGAAVVLLIVAPFAGVRRPERCDMPSILLCGATGMAAYQLLLNAGEQTVTAGTASLLISTAPVFSLVISSRVLGERIPGRRWFGLAVALAGSAIVALSAGDGLALRPGAIAVIGAAAVQGTYHVAQRPLLARHTPMEVATYGMVAGALMLLPAIPATVRDVGSASPGSLRAVALLAVGPSAIGFVTWAAAVARLHVSRPALALYAVPVVAIAVSFVWLDERPRALGLIGGAVSLVGVAVGTLLGSGRSTRPIESREHERCSDAARAPENA
jgi:drug/metabolite transporter (DMT)-like permease